MPKVKNILYFLLIVALFSVFLNRFGIPAYHDLLRDAFQKKKSVWRENVPTGWEGGPKKI